MIDYDCDLWLWLILSHCLKMFTYLEKEREKMWYVDKTWRRNSQPNDIQNNNTRHMNQNTTLRTMKRDSELYCVNAQCSSSYCYAGCQYAECRSGECRGQNSEQQPKNKGMIQTIVVGKIFLVNAVTRNVYIWCQCYEAFYNRNLRIFAIS
jgi:hypothetical protein